MNQSRKVFGVACPMSGLSQQQSGFMPPRCVCVCKCKCVHRYVCTWVRVRDSLLSNTRMESPTDTRCFGCNAQSGHHSPRPQTCQYPCRQQRPNSVWNTILLPFEILTTDLNHHCGISNPPQGVESIVGHTHNNQWVHKCVYTYHLGARVRTNTIASRVK